MAELEVTNDGPYFVVRSGVAQCREGPCRGPDYQPFAVKPVVISKSLPPELTAFLNEVATHPELEDQQSVINVRHFRPDKTFDHNVVLSRAMEMQDICQSDSNWPVMSRFRELVENANDNIHFKEQNALTLVFDLIAVQRYLRKKMDEASAIRARNEWRELFSYLSTLRLSAIRPLETTGRDLEIDFTRSFVSSLETADVRLSLIFFGEINPPPIRGSGSDASKSRVDSDDATVAKSWLYHIKKSPEDEKSKAFKEFHQELSDVARRYGLIHGERLPDQTTQPAASDETTVSSVSAPYYSASSALSWAEFAWRYNVQRGSSVSFHRLTAKIRPKVPKGRVHWSQDIKNVAAYGFETVGLLRACNVMANRPDANEGYFVMKPEQRIIFKGEIAAIQRKDHRNPSEPNLQDPTSTPSESEQALSLPPWLLSA
ncbi:hypothetical protein CAUPRSCDRAFT_11116 [Caulochytrium protostelioides]|uniref:Uncharacterized protein n=1 Tax=Caulochytrium protostelioides TaxID=1555241 RepID=A0A4P9WV70_9FUNG|nr:hypothetical protein CAUPRSCDRAFT_11116 [Caulochytrium protostelioides]